MSVHKCFYCNTEHEIVSAKNLHYWRNYAYKHHIQDPFDKMRRRTCQTEDASSGTVVIVDPLQEQSATLRQNVKCNRVTLTD